MNQRSHNTLFSVPSVTIRLGVGLTLLVAALTFLYWLASDSWRPILIFFGAGLAAVGQLATAFYASRTMRHALQVEERRLALEETSAKKQLEDAAARFGERWTDASMFHLRKECRELIENRNNPEAILKSLNADPAKATNAGNILNFLEELALSANKSRCNEEIARDLFCGIVLNIWHATEPWVKQQRVSRGRQQLWVQLQSLYERWKQ
jgi:hypothetical protein